MPYTNSGNVRQPVVCVFAGDIAAYVGNKDTTTGDSLCSEDHLILLEPIQFPEPVIKAALKASSLEEEEQLLKILNLFEFEDPTIQIGRDEAGALFVAGMGELHIEIVLESIRREFVCKTP